MSRSAKSIYSIIVMFAIGVVVAFVAVWLSQKAVISLKNNPFVIDGVGRDGWTSSEATVDLATSLKDVGKEASVIVEISGWRPAGAQPSDVTVRLCGVEERRTFPGSDETFHFKISKSLCPEPQLSIQTAELFQSADKRKLGVRFQRVTLRSRAPLLVLEKNSFWIAAGVLGSIASAMFLLSGAWLAMVSVLAGGALVSIKHWDSEFELLVLGVALLTFLLSWWKSTVTAAPEFRERGGGMVAMVFIALIGAAIRFYGIDFGLPHYFHPDEARKARIAERMYQTGDLDPNYFLHPSLLLYSTAVVGGVRASVFNEEPTRELFAESGRMVSAVAGVISIVLVFLIARMMGGETMGLLAATLATFSPLLVACSRYLKEDSLVVMWILLTTFLSFRGAKRDNPGWFWLAGVTVGFAFGSKYSGILAVVPLVMFPIVYRRFNRRWFYALAIACAMVPLAFLITSPYVLLNHAKFIADFDSERRHMIEGHHATIISPWDHYWAYHLARSILPAVGWMVMLFSFVSVAEAIRNWRGVWLAMVCLALVFYLPAEFVNAKPPPQPERYILPVIPFLCILGSAGILTVRSGLWRGVFMVIAVLMVAVPSLRLAYEVPFDTRNRMGDWMVQNLPVGSKILIDATPYTPSLPSHIFPKVKIGAPDERRGMTFASLKEDGVQYVLVTSLSYDRYFHTRTSDQVIRRRFEELFAQGELLHTEEPWFKTYGFHNPTLKLFRLPAELPKG